MSMTRFTLLFGSLFLPFFALALSGPGSDVVRSYSEERFDEAYLDSLAGLYGVEGAVPESYRTPFLIAISAYPELQGVPIHFEEGDLKTSMAAQPVPSSLFGPRGERRYRILVDTLDPGSEGKLFSELPFDARIGIMAHELAHVLDYVDRDIGGLLQYGLRYVFEGSRKALEARTDRIAVDRGFGWQLLAFKAHLREKAELAPSYLAYKEKIYLSAEDLRGLLQEHSSYPSSMGEL